MKHTDIVGNPLDAGDIVAFDVLSYKRSRLQIGTVTSIAPSTRDGYPDVLTISYTGHYSDRKVTVVRLANAVAKVAG